MKARVVLDSGRPVAQHIPNAVHAAVAILKRDAGEKNFIRMGFILDFLFGVVNLVIFALISRALHGQHNQVGNAASYFDFVAIGITFMLVVQAASTQITSRVQEEQRSGTLEILLTRPISTAALAIGMSAYPMLLAMVRAVAYIAAAALLLGLEVGSADWFGLLTVLVLGGVVLMCVGIALAAFAVAFDHGSAVARLLVVALSFASGTYFPVTVLPTSVRWITTPLPTRIALDGLRSAMAGRPWAGSALVLAGAAAIALPCAIWLFAQALKFATGRGTLTRV